MFTVYNKSEVNASIHICMYIVAKMHAHLYMYMTVFTLLRKNRNRN